MNPTLKIQVSIDHQTLKVLQGDQCLHEYPVSTAAKGMGFLEGSYRTPTGRFRIAEKIGGSEALGTIFKARVPVGVWDGDSKDGDLILSRILWLDGLDPENANTKDRYIYIHGTHREDLLGRPASHGCIRMANADIIEFFELVVEGAEVEILPATRKRGKLLFIDCDSTLSTIEGIDELAHCRGEEIYRQVVDLTHLAMNGEVPIAEIFPRRMDLIRPDRVVCDAIATQYIEQEVAGVADFLDEARQRGWQLVILSGGFAPLIRPLADKLGIEHVEAVPIHFDDQGGYLDYGRDYPTTRNLGKNEVIRDWKQAMLPEKVVMMGDGVSDLETQPDVDLFVGFGGVVARPKVREGAGYWLDDMIDRAGLWQVVEALG